MSNHVAFGHYQIEEKLGEGGMGVVYRARDTELDRVVALKTLLASMVSDPELLERFTREAKAASRLQHPAIVTIYHIGQERDTRYIVMEYVQGKTLKGVIGGKPMSAALICKYGVQLTDALVLAHEKNVIHRDLKAENIMIAGERGQVKILDFGLAKLKEKDHDPDATSLTQAGVVIGTVSHMSPEQTLGLDVDGRSDVWSMGVVFYEMATGAMPFDAPSMQATMARVLNQEPTPVAMLNPGLPRELADLIHDCLRKDRDQRPTAADVNMRMKRIEASLSAGSLAAAQSGVTPVSGDLPTGRYPSGFASAAGAAPATQRISASGVPLPPTKTPSGRSSMVGAPVARPVQRSSSRTMMAPVEAPEPGKVRTAKIVYGAVHWIRVATSLALLSIPLAFVAHFVIGGKLIKHELIANTAFDKAVTAIVEPALKIGEKVLNFNTKVVGEGEGEGVWQFLDLGFAVLAFMARHAVLFWVQRVENSAKNKLVGLTTATVASGRHQAAKLSSHRVGMLREYAEARKLLFQEKRKLGFLSVDVVGSTKMKAGEDKLTIEHAFAEYKKFVERILNQNNIWKVAWTPDGIMCAFQNGDDAVNAGRQVLQGLPWFNDGVHQLRTPFNVRCGVNVGEVVFPEEKRMEEVSDEVIDVAGHMQKDAGHGTLWIAEQAYSELADKSGFEPTTEIVDGFNVMQWKP